MKPRVCRVLKCLMFDDEPLLMGEWMAALAQVLQRVPPEQISRAQMQAQVSPMRWSFMRESRRLRNAKLKSTGFVLRHPSALAFLHTQVEAIRAFAAQAEIIMRHSRSLRWLVVMVVVLAVHAAILPV